MSAEKAEADVDVEKQQQQNEKQEFQKPNVDLTPQTPHHHPPSLTKKKDSSDDPALKVEKKATPYISASVVFLYATFAAMFTVGWVSLNICPLNMMIPIYLIVAGATGILTKALLRSNNKYIFSIVIVLALFDLAWQGYGSYVVYKEFQPNFDPTLGPYCYRPAYLLAFWIITIVYAMLGLFIMLSCCYFLMRKTFVKC